MSKYIFTNENYRPICIAHYADDKRAIEEAEKMEKEMKQVVYVVRHVGVSVPVQSHAEDFHGEGIA